jgi:membrane protease subunit HflK
MPWNDNANPGPWGAPPGGDGDRRNRESPPRRDDDGEPRGPRRPDFGAGFNRAGRRLRDLFGAPGGGFRPGALAAAAGVVLALWALSGVYIVQPSEKGVVLTFGAYSRTTDPGARYHLPWPIEHVEKVASPA